MTRRAVLLDAIAALHCIGRTQAEIARELSVSPATVARCLAGFAGRPVVPVDDMSATHADKTHHAACAAIL